MLSKSYHPRENGLNIGTHALVLFISVIISFVLHLCFAFFYDSIIEEASFQTAKIKDERKEMSLDAPLRFKELNRIIGIAQETQALSPDIQQATETTNVHDLADDAIAQALQAPQIPDRPVVPDATHEASFSLPGEDRTELPPPPIATIHQEVIALPEKKDHIEGAWKMDASIERESLGSDIASLFPVDSSFVDGSSIGGTGEDFKPTGSGSGLTGLFQETSSSGDAKDAQPNLFAPGSGSVFEQLSKEATAAIEEQGLQIAADDVLATVPELPEAKSEEAIEKLFEESSIATLSKTDEPPRKFVAIDKSLSVALKLYTTEADPTHNYYQIDIVRRHESLLPIMPKDVVFIQDVSGSIGRKRMEACKVALKSALYHSLRHGDRFTIFAFRDFTLTPNASWMTFDSTSHEKVNTFIDSLRARGNTDIFALLSQDLPTLERDPKRPLIAIIITDGEATAGETETTKIIGEFTRLNKGNIAVYTFNAKRFDPYFLDMLCYSNRGENISSSGKPDKVQEELQPIFDKIRNPVMKDVELAFDSQSASEIHPKKLTHLFADRYLTVYGRVPKSVQEISCQLKGQAADRNYDAVFQFNLKDATCTDENLRSHWAKRAMFDMLAEYASNPSEILLREIETFSQHYHIQNPYRSVPTKTQKQP